MSGTPPNPDGPDAASTAVDIFVRSEQLVRLFPLPAAIVDASDRCRVVNTQFLETFGYDPGEIATMGEWFRLVLADAEDSGPIADLWTETVGLDEGAVRRQTLSVRCRDGRQRQVSLRTAALGEGCRFVTIEDLCGLSSTHEALSVADRNLMEIIEFLPDPTFVINREGEVIAWNRAIEELTGVPKEEMLGCGGRAYAVPFYDRPRPLLVDLVLDEDEEEFRAYTRVTRQGRTLMAETFIPSWNEGAGVHLWGKASPLFGPAGQIAGAIESIRDITAYRQTEEELRRSEERYRGLVETLRDVIYEVDAEGRITYTSPAVTAVTGYAPEEVVGRSLLDLVDPRDRDRVRRGIACAMAGEAGPGDVRLVMASGEVKCFRTDARPILIDGEPAGLRGVLSDITDRVAAEAAVRWNEALLAEMAEASPFGYYAVDDRAGRILYCNDRFCDLWGLGDLREQIRGGGIEHRDVLARCAGMVRSGVVFAGPDREGSELALADGRRIWQYSTPLGDDGDRRFGRFHLFEDVTAQERMLEELRAYRDRLEDLVDERTGALRESEERLRLAQESANVAVWDWDVRTGRQTYTKEMLRLYGLDEDRIHRYDLWREHVHPDDLDRIEAERDAALACGAPFDLEFRIVPPAGDIRWLASIGRGVYDDQGALVRVLGVNIDITGRKTTELVLARSAEDLARSNEELQQFAYVASHDLQEPLRSIVSFSRLLEQRYRGELDADADEFIAYIVTGGERMQALIRDLLRVSRVETQAKEPVPTDADAVVFAAVRALEAQIRASDATVTFGSLPAVVADWSQLEQVFANLIGNAVKYRHPERQPRIRVDARRAGSMVEFAVRDNGIGIEPEYFDRIFEMFRRLHTHDEYEGTGIGLAIVKKIVERHGGTIRVESTPGEGSTFLFTLPAA